MNIKIITNKKDYKEAKQLLISLIEKNTVENQDIISVLALLIENYEKEEYDIGLPDPVSAIEFRMEQENLSRKDMIKYLGTKSRVSEILGKKKTLSLSMIRALHEGLGISYEVLMQDQRFELDKRDVEYTDYPINAMFKLGYFDKAINNIADAKSRAEELIKGLFEPVGLNTFEECSAHLRKSEAHTTNKKMDLLALSVWQAKVLNQTLNVKLPTCDLTRIDLDFMRDILKLSSFDKGPLLAKEMLAKHGIHLIFEQHLPKTYLDGAAMLGVDGNPVIGMTIRYDRLDNFWFVLMHELAHVSLHLKDTDKIFFDDLDGNNVDDSHEDEADEKALEASMSVKDWEKYFCLLDTPNSVIKLANKYGISPAIIAGRYRKEVGDYRVFNRLIGSKEVKRMIFN